MFLLGKFPELQVPLPACSQPCSLLDWPGNVEIEAAELLLAGGIPLPSAKPPCQGWFSLGEGRVWVLGRKYRLFWHCEVEGVTHSVGQEMSRGRGEGKKVDFGSEKPISPSQSSTRLEQQRHSGVNNLFS